MCLVYVYNSRVEHSVASQEPQGACRKSFPPDRRPTAQCAHYTACYTATHTFRLHCRATRAARGALWLLAVTLSLFSRFRTPLTGPKPQPRSRVHNIFCTARTALTTARRPDIRRVTLNHIPDKRDREGPHTHTDTRRPTPPGLYTLHTHAHTHTHTSKVNRPGYRPEASSAGLGESNVPEGPKRSSGPSRARGACASNGYSAPTDHEGRPVRPFSLSR